MLFSELFGAVKTPKRLTEAPYGLEGKLKRPSWNTFTSDTSLTRLYTPLGKIQVADDEVTLHLLKPKTSVIGTIKAEKDNELSNRVIFSLKLKKKHTLAEVPKGINKAKILQVDKVAVDPDFEGRGIASYAYSALAEQGYSVLSDVAQFQDGKQLWKRMAAKAHLRNYRIFILDSSYGVQKKDGRPLEYNGSNIDDAEIWSSGEDYSKYHVLLMMVHKG